MNVKVNSTIANPPAKVNDSGFSTLAIVLLELCFGRRLEDHPMWESPGYGILQNDHNLRQTVAREWLKEVQEDAGQPYATAVSWALLQSPGVLKDERWREEFAQNVVQPLQRYYEYLHPSKTS